MTRRSGARRFGIAVTALLWACEPATPSPPDAGSEADAGPTDGGATDAGASPDGSGTPADAGVDAGVDAGPAPEPTEHVTITRLADACADMPTDYGTYGAVTEYDRYELPNPSWPAAGPMPLVVLSPTSDAIERPVLFYSHAFGGTEWRRMLGLLEVLVSQGFVVVFVPYPTTGTSVCGRYDTLAGGFAEAVSALAGAARMDLSRVGFVGHSFGGGASASMARVALVEHGSGSAGSFIFASAPWYVYRMDDAAAWEALSATRLVLMVYADDTVNDDRIAIDQVLTPFVGTASFLRLHADGTGACELVPDHGTPPSYEGIDALDTWGLWRHAHALAACTLRGDAAACDVVEDTAMGHWLDGGEAITPLEVTTTPTPSHPSADYTFPIDEAPPCIRAD